MFGIPWKSSRVPCWSYAVWLESLEEEKSRTSYPQVQLFLVQYVDVMFLPSIAWHYWWGWQGISQFLRYNQILLKEIPITATYVNKWCTKMVKRKRKYIKWKKAKLPWLRYLSKSIVWIYPALLEIQSFQHSKEQCPMVALASGR